jgi:accessory colonization factor AcfC
MVLQVVDVLCVWIDWSRINTPSEAIVFLDSEHCISKILVNNTVNLTYKMQCNGEKKLSKEF